MAIGTRILSDNLSGKTADVTFLPLSGGTINVGMETIPFNYYDTYPYGTYQLYFAEYDYTYEIIVADPTPLILTLEPEYTPGSLVAKYTLTSNVYVSQDVTITFDNTLGLFSGGTVIISTGVTIPYGNITGQTIVTLTGQTYDNWNGSTNFTNFSGAPSGSTINYTNSNSQQTLLGLSTVSSSTNYHFASLNYGELTAELIDLNIDSDLWPNFEDWVPMNENGYMFILEDNSNNALAVFTNSVGVVKDSFTASTNYDYYGIGGVLAAFVDYDNGKLFYGDAINPTKTFTWDPSEYNGELNWDYDISDKHGNFGFKLIKLDNTNQINYLITRTDEIILTEFNPANLDKYYGMYLGGDFMYEFTYNNNTSLYESLKLFNSSDGTVLQTIVFSGSQTYNSFYNSFYSDNQYMVVLYNYSDNNVDYLILHYDGNANNLITQTHNRSNYTSLTIQSNEKYSPSNIGSDSVYLILYTVTNYDNRVGHQVSYLDVIYKFSGESSFTTYTYQDSGVSNKWMYVYPQCGNNLFTTCDTGDGNVSVFSITQTGASTTVITAKTNVLFFSTNYFANSAVVRLYTTTPNEIIFSYVNEQGVVSDTMTKDTSGGWDVGATYGVWFALFDGTNEGYYLNESTTGFTSMPYYNQYNYTNSYYQRNNFESPPTIVFYDNNTYDSQVLTKNSISSVVTLPATNGTQLIRVGKDRYYYLYLDSVTNFMNIVLNDFDNNLVFSAETNYTSWNSVYAVKDRYFVRVNDGTNFIYHLISDSGIETVETNNIDYDILINDYIWWA